MNKQVIVMSGVSGSGKTTYIQEVLLGRKNDEKRITWDPFSDYSFSFVIVSADNFFFKEGEYRFNPMLLGEAHAKCFRDFIEAMENEVNLVIVDNTNTTASEIAPYMLGASAFHYSAEIHELRVSESQLESCIARNSKRAPSHAVQRQLQNMETRELPPYWKLVGQMAKF